MGMAYMNRTQDNDGHVPAKSASSSTPDGQGQDLIKGPVLSGVAGKDSTSSTARVRRHRQRRREGRLCLSVEIFVADIGDLIALKLVSTQPSRAEIAGAVENVIDFAIAAMRAGCMPLPTTSAGD